MKIAEVWLWFCKAVWVTWGGAMVLGTSGLRAFCDSEERCQRGESTHRTVGQVTLGTQIAHKNHNQTSTNLV